MVRTVTRSECHWKTCPEQPVAFAAMGTYPDITQIHEYCAEHLGIIQDLFRTRMLTLSAPHDRRFADEMIIQEIP